MKKRTQWVWVVGLLPLLIAGCNNGGDDGVTPPAGTLRITAVNPTSLSRGAESAPVTINGAGFTNAVTVDLGPGIEIAAKTVADPQTIQLSVNVSLTAAPGSRTVVVTVGGNSSRLDSGLTISENRAPLASFIVNPSAGTIRSTFQLDASASTDEDGSIASYRWQISDGTNPQGKFVQKTFDKKGTYTATLTITDNQGGISTAVKELEVGDNLPPTAVFTMNPGSGTQLTNFTFDASSCSDPDGQIDGYSWDFEDGTATGKVVTHRFKSEGSYLVELRVKDSNGAFAFDRKTVRVAFFDKEKAIEEISAVAIDFLRQFDKFLSLPTEAVVRGFSKNPACRGRDREMEIIENEKKIIRSSGVEILGSPVVSYVDDQRGKASIRARFYGTTNDGDDYDGVATHYLNMIHEGDVWSICDFYLIAENSASSLPAVMFAN